MTSPGLFQITRDPTDGERRVEVALRGVELTDLPILNKGTAFTDAEREHFALRGLLPPHVCTIEQQSARVYANYAQKTTDLERYIHLISLLDRNETLFYRVLLEHIEEMLPIVYTPTVGLACQEFGKIYRRHRGLYITPEDVNRMDDILAHWPYADVAIIVVTDGERILGLGDLGASGMGISIGKISLYVAGAGFHPSRTLPVCIDVGTDNERLRNAPFYLGRRAPRLRGAEYDRVIEAFIAAATRRFPQAIIQFEDFAEANASRLLDAYRTRARCFNDDIQGTGTVALAGLLSGLRIAGETVDAARIFIVGAGSAGIGIARMLPTSNVWMFDSKGLLTRDRQLADRQRPFARDEAPGDLLTVARRVRPNVLVGVTGHSGIFTRELIESMSGARPLIFPLSNPTSKAECVPEQVLAWTNGRAILASGSPFPGTAQCNNLYVFPGVGLGVIASGAAHVTDALFLAAARRLSELAPPGEIYPSLRDIRHISREIALAVGKTAIETGLAAVKTTDELTARIDREIWYPDYLSYRPVGRE